MQRQQRKLHKEKMKEKRARLIVRNLPFSTTEDNLREYYQKYGEVVDVDLLRKPDGKLVGCAFIQFKLVQNAAKARHHTNGKEFIGRTIECDFALAKHKYQERLLKGDEIKKEDIKTETEVKQEPIEIKEEPVDDIEDSNAVVPPVEVKTEDVKSEDESNAGTEECDVDVPDTTVADEENKDEDMPFDDKHSGENQDEEMESNEEKEELDEEMQTDEEKPPQEEEDEESDEDVSESESEREEIDEHSSETSSVTSKKPQVISNDVVEGKTVFIKNVPFDATNEDLRECMSQFGPLYYALICIDKLTEHSKGTAFVKFKVKMIHMLCFKLILFCNCRMQKMQKSVFKQALS